MGVSEEVGKVANSTVEALKSQPLALVLLAINVMFLAATIYFLHDLTNKSAVAQLRKDTLISDMMERCLLSVPPKSDK